MVLNPNGGPTSSTQNHNGRRSVLPALALAVAAIGAASFAFAGLRAGLAAFGAIRSAKSDPTSRAAVAGDTAVASRPPSALHISARGATGSDGGAVQPVSEAAGSNFCDDVELLEVAFDGSMVATSRGGNSPSPPQRLRQNVSVAGVVPIGSYHYYQVMIFQL